MKSIRNRLILGLIAATVIAADEQVVHLYRINKAGNQSFNALMEKPHQCGLPVLVTTTGSLPYGLWLPADCSRMHVALENEDAVAVFDTDKRYEVARIPASQAPRAIVRLTGVAASEENRELLEPVDVDDSSHCGEKPREAWNARSPQSAGPMDFLEVQVWGLIPGTCHRVMDRSLGIEKLVSGIESLFGTRF